MPTIEYDSAGLAVAAGDHLAAAAEIDAVLAAYAGIPVHGQPFGRVGSAPGAAAATVAAHTRFASAAARELADRADLARRVGATAARSAELTADTARRAAQASPAVPPAR